MCKLELRAQYIECVGENQSREKENWKLDL